MAVELASAYVSIIPTTKGLQGNLEKELSPLTGAAAKAGNDSGKALGSSFTGASGGLKSSLGESESHFGNFKTKATGALDSVGISTGMLAAGAGAAIIGFGISALNAFTDTAKAALDMSTSTGLSIEESSRWIAVGDDMGISADTLQGSLGKVAKTLDDTKWAEYGIATRDAGGEALPVNDILLDSFDKLGKISNETERARVGTELFGKGYANLSPLIGQSREELEKYLGSVEKGQVITDSEAAAAEKARLAQDELSDAMGELGLAAGQLLTHLTPVITAIAKAVGWAVDLAEAYAAVTFATKDTTVETDAFASSVDDQHVGMGNVIADFKQLVNTNFNAQSGIQKTAGFFDVLTGITKESDDNLRVFTNTFNNLAKTSPEAALQVVDGFDLLVIAANAGDESAQATLDTYGLTADKLNELRSSVDGYTAAQKDGTLTIDEQKKATEEATAATEAAAEETAIYQAAIDENNKALKEEADLLNEQADALLAQASAMRGAADHTYAVNEATRAYNDHLEGLKTTIKEAKGDQDLINAAYEEGATLAAAHADAVAQLAEDNATAAGVTLTATEKQDAWNKEMLFSAQQAGPEQRAEILRYIAQANGIPAEKVTDIEALIDAGKFDEADALLAELSTARTADVVADAKTAQADIDLNATADRIYEADIIAEAQTAAARSDLDTLKKPIIVTVTPNLIGWTDPMAKWKLPGHAAGTGDTGFGPFIAGEHGPELIVDRPHATVFNASDTRSLMAGVSSQTSNATSTPPIVVNNNRRDIGVADLNHVLAMARLAS